MVNQTENYSIDFSTTTGNFHMLHYGTSWTERLTNDKAVHPRKESGIGLRKPIFWSIMPSLTAHMYTTLLSFLSLLVLSYVNLPFV
jgi:hypothetical protein